MLSIDIRNLEQHPVQVDDYLAEDDPVWEATDARPSEPVHVSGRLSRAGDGRFLWSGRLEGTVQIECRRCLAELEVDVEDATHVLFADADSPEAEDPDVYVLDPNANTIDLRPALREQWLLNVPRYVLCDEACRGICPRCGADRNAADCGCGAAADPRWDALRGAGGDAR